MKNIFILSTFIIALSTVSLSGQVLPSCEPGDIRQQLSKDDIVQTDTLPDLGPLNDSAYLAAMGPSDYRMVYFLHGLNGDDGAWQRPASSLVFNDGSDIVPREVYIKHVDYNLFQNSFSTASVKVIEQLDPRYDLLQHNYKPIDGIMIGHSQGGLVGRYTDRFYSEDANKESRKFGGLVTFGSTHQGAQILNNIIQVQGLIGSLASDLSAGPVSEFSQSDKFFVRIVSNLVDIDNLANSIKDIFVFDIMPAIIKNNVPNIASEYNVGHPTLDLLNTYTPKVFDSETGLTRNTNLVAFYGVRDNIREFENVSESTIRSFHYNNFNGIYTPIYEHKTVSKLKVPISLAAINYFVNEVTAVNDFRAMEEEWKLAFQMHFLRMEYLAKEVKNKELEKEYQVKRNRALVALSAIPSIPPFLELRLAHSARILNLNKKMNDAKARKNAWNKGVQILDDFDRRYKVAVGIRTMEGIETLSTDFCKCHMYDMIQEVVLYDFPEYEYDPLTSCGAEYERYAIDNQTEVICQIVSGVTYQPGWLEKPSDGVALAESAMDIPQHTSEPRPMPNSTHMSMRNDANTIWAMNLIFSGGVGDFFYTNPK